MQAPPGITQMPDAAQAGYQRAPCPMQSLATATAPMGGGQMPGMPPGIPAPTSMEPGTFTMAQGGPQPHQRHAGWQQPPQPPPPRQSRQGA